MKYQIQQREDGVEVEVSDVVGNEGKLMEAFQACQQGQCSCPTEEYKKLDGMEVEKGEDGIRLRLKARAGERFDSAEIERCLQHTSHTLRDGKA